MTSRAALSLSCVFALLAALACDTPPAKSPEPDPLGSPTGSTSGVPSAPPSASVTPAAQALSPDVERGARALEAGNAKEAKPAFEAALAKNPNDAEALYYLGVLAEQSGDKAKASAQYQAALVAKPALEAASINLGALHIDAQKWDDALRVTRDALKLSRSSAGLQANLAIALAGQGGHEEESGKAFEAAEKLAPKDAMIVLTHGQWLGKWKQTDAAKQKLRAAADLAGDDVGLLASAGFELKNVGAFGDCIKVLDKAIAKRDAAELRTYRALCRLGDKDKPGALTDLQAATSKEPNYAPAHFYLGGRLAEDGKRAEAQRAYETYLKLEPKGPLAATAAERVKLLQKKK